MGIDPSLTGTGLVLLNEDGDLLDQRVVKSKRTGVLRLFDIQNEVQDFLATPSIGVGYICMEGYGYAAQKCHSLGEAGGAIKLAVLWTFGEQDLVAYPTIVAPNQLKKFATGKGTGEKSDIKLWIYKRWGEELRDNNVADAYVLARIALSLMTGKTNTSYEQDVINALFKAKGGENGVHVGAPAGLVYEIDRGL